MSKLKLEHVDKVYKGKRSKDDFHAVKDFNLEVDKKEFIVFVGPSGCGKSTTLRMIAGLEDITKGNLFIDDELVNKIEPQFRNIAMVFQNYALYPHMTSYQNMAFGLKNMKVKKVMTKWVKDESSSENPDKSLILKLKKDLSAKKRLLNKELKKGQVDLELVKKTRKEVLALEKEIEVNSHIGLKEVTLKEISKEILSNLNKELKEITSLNAKEEKEEYKTQIEKINEGIKYYSTHEVDMVRNRHLSRKEIDDKIFDAAEILGVTSLLYRLPKAMSGGQRQRIALGRAIVRTPKIFLLDEPLSNLDAKLRSQMRVEITKLYEKLDIPFIYVTHDQVEAMTMGTRIVVLRDGVTQQIDTPSNLFDYPANRFVAGFLGTPQMNFYEVSLKGNKNEIVINLPGENKLSFKPSDIRPINGEYLDNKYKDAILGIRPEDVKIVKSGIPAKVTLVENLGNETIIYCDLDSKKKDSVVDTKSSITVKVSERVDYKEGDIINLEIKINKIHLFSSDEEESILSR